MQQNVSTQFNDTLAIISPEVSEVSFNTWFKDIKPVAFKNNVLTLVVPSMVARNMLETRYKDLLLNAVRIAYEQPNADIKLMLESELDTNHPNHTRTQPSYKNQTDLNPKYTFDTFVVGNSNRFAHAAALAVAEAPARAYNPLFLHGVAGLGKTHLMHAIGHHILEQNPESKVVYVSSESFTNELINSIKDDKNQEFRNKYRNVDVLLVDDIQFIAGKESTQEEFFHTFNTLHGANKQIILTSDRSPKEINTLEERLRSRFEWGLIGDIQTPDLETRIAILKKKAQSKNLDIPDEIFTNIASKVKSNIRELEGALNQIIAFSAVIKQQITLDLVDEALKDYLKGQEKKNITPQYILQMVANHFSLTIEDLKSAKRNKAISYPRQISMYLMRELTTVSLPKIGELLGNRDHTTVMHGTSRIEEDIRNDVYFKNMIEDITKNIQGN
ncbi:MAG: chromosomal replication initiator protein DnaA [Hyphomonadaceae bacterium]|nr:chromosomal replication initiator protein DnaA [Clostridia bacterium]